MTTEPLASHSPSSPDDGEVHHHVASARRHVIVLLALLGFTALTVGAYTINLGEWNLVAAVVISTLKAALVVWFFMELKDDVAFNRLVFLGAVIFIGLFMAYTMNDTRHRNRVDAYNGARVDPRSGEFAGGTAAGIVAQGGELGPLPVIAAESDGEAAHE
ncbi:MAG: hypothetical protein GXP55_12250 [Deltaproteobacteria bacterium]|nr:hypothetical protein [Deltaproteobacteria bacterium]